MGTDVQDLLTRSLRELSAPPDLAERVTARYRLRRRHRRIVSGVSAVVLTAAAVIAAWATVDTSSQGRPAVVTPAISDEAGSGELIPEAQRRPAPELAGTTIEGKAVRIDLRRGETQPRHGAITVVTFGGSWCAPCVRQQPAFAPLNVGPVPIIEGSGVSFVAVAERDSLVNARAYARKFHVDYPTIFDSDGRLAKAWHLDTGPPVTVVVDEDGLVAARFDGAITRSQLLSVTEALTADQRGLRYTSDTFAAGIREVQASGRRLTITWDNLKCGDVVDLLDQVQVRENVNAVHLEVLATTNPALDQADTGCLGVGVQSSTRVTLSAPLGNRLVFETSTGKAVAVRGS
jgi:thiol-disulfide isomerase/thioredoxin